MELPSVRAYKGRSLPRLLQLDPQQKPDPPEDIQRRRRRSSGSRSEPKGWNLGSHHEEEQLEALASTQIGGAITLKSQEDTLSRLPQNDGNGNQRPVLSVEGSAEKRLKRARLTKKNLKALEKMERVGQVAKQASKANSKSSSKSSTKSSNTTTTDKSFGKALLKNNILPASAARLAPAAEDATEVQTLLDNPRQSDTPDESTYQRYLMVTDALGLELDVEFTAYPLLAKRSPEREYWGYFPRLNHPWSAVENSLTAGLSAARPDLVESYGIKEFPYNVVETLSGDFCPSEFDEAMPTYAVEFKSFRGDLLEAKFQCAYDGGLMTEGARVVHTFLGKPDEEFVGRTQALTIAFNGDTYHVYGHHALEISPSPQPAGEVPGGADSSTDDGVTYRYIQYQLASGSIHGSFENFQRAYKHIRNAQDIAYNMATERKNELCARKSGHGLATPQAQH